METTVTIAMYAAGAYLLTGVFLLIPFHRRAVRMLDESAHGASRGFRMLVSPGLIALWPIILHKWMAVRRGMDPHGSPDGPVSSVNIRRMQSLLMKLIAVALPLLFAAALFGRPAPAPAFDPADLSTVERNSGD